MNPENSGGPVIIGSGSGIVLVGGNGNGTGGPVVPPGVGGETHVLIQAKKHRDFEFVFGGKSRFRNFDRSPSAGPSA